MRAVRTPPDSASASGYDLDRQVGFLLRQVQQRHTSIFAEAFGEEMTPLQWSALAKLAEVGDCSQNHLGRQIATDVATIKGVVERLVKRGLLATGADPADRRRLLVRLTAAGRASYEDRVATARSVTTRTLEPLAESEKAEFLELLGRMR